MMMYKALHPKDDIDRLYVARKESKKEQAVKQQNLENQNEKKKNNCRVTSKRLHTRWPGKG